MTGFASSVVASRLLVLADEQRVIEEADHACFVLGRTGLVGTGVACLCDLPQRLRLMRVACARRGAPESPTIIQKDRCEQRPTDRNLAADPELRENRAGRRSTACGEPLSRFNVTPAPTSST
jgi:hypothetical protein